MSEHVADGAKTLALLLVVSLLQVSTFTPLEVAQGHADVVLVVLVSLALLRGPLLGAVAGFWAGLVVDMAALQTLGETSLLLTLAGYYAGRFGQATTRRSPHPPLVAVALASIALVVASGLLHFLLGQGVSVATLLVGVLVPTLALNVLLAYPLYRLVARLFPAAARERPRAAAVV